MFTLQQINEAHSKVASGKDFAGYLQEIKKLGVLTFETLVEDSSTIYFGDNNFKIQSESKYPKLTIAKTSNAPLFISNLQQHQKGHTDYVTFCKHCAEAGIKKWVVNLENACCTYFDRQDKVILKEQIPS